jgi:hypothetical protein
MTQDKPDSDTDIGAQAIYEAVQKIVSDETRALLDADPVAAQNEADMARRIEAAQNRLTGGGQTPPTLLEALILEALEPPFARMDRPSSCANGGAFGGR